MFKLRFTASTSFLLLILLISCTDISNKDRVYFMNFNCRNVYWAEDAEGIIIDFEIESISNYEINLQDNKKDIFDTSPKVNDRGFVLKNLCNNKEVRLFDFNDSKLILLPNGNAKFHLCSVVTSNNLINSLKNDNGWYIDYNGDVLFTNTKDTSIQSRLSSTNIKILLNDLKLEKQTTEKIILGSN